MPLSILQLAQLLDLADKHAKTSTHYKELWETIFIAVEDEIRLRYVGR